jgi:ribosomal protein S18 acetylase RimI-like enzyme
MQRITENEVDFVDFREGKAGNVEIFDIAVNSERGKGVGSRLLQRVAKDTGAVILYAFCRDTNELAHAFYKKNGFVGHDVPNFYEDGGAKLFVHETSK